MQLELISHALCPFVHRACIMLREKGVEYTRRDVDLENKPEWFLALSPRGKVPVLVADGAPLFESAAIVEFLDETHPPPVIPTEPFTRARQRAWVEVASDLLMAQYRVYIAATQADFEAAAKAATAALARYDEALNKGDLASDEFKLVEVATAPAMYRFALLEARTGWAFWPAGSKVEAWARRLASRPSVTSSVAEDFPDRFMKFLTEKGSYMATVRPS
ncbi:glutathione S-transferase family protein [Nannocystis punicea]|uniref:Glutathione S-transferase family protein n=1 Tax=Nannocystis punicea TaxID=2995304 RepID=A0ABY7HGE1_9BACT|nr:glutathione S-transferase family protein [Nannocystis poenicansa]WAS98362.1 glutathione S-transferase family protein [Nannocystis poenicansa]